MPIKRDGSVGALKARKRILTRADHVIVG